MGDALRMAPFMINPALDIPMKKRDSPVFLTGELSSSVFRDLLLHHLPGRNQPQIGELHLMQPCGKNITGFLHEERGVEVGFSGRCGLDSLHFVLVDEHLRFLVAKQRGGVVNPVVVVQAEAEEADSFLEVRYALFIG